MSIHHEPLVSVLTPVYNGGEFLAECIESVLKQTYRNLEYLIVNNRSADATLEVAEHYAKQDSRIRVHNNSQFVPVIENHNIAFRLISPDARYCKVVSADDFLFPDCIAQLVDCAEAHPTAAMIGSYQLSGAWVRWQGFQYPGHLTRGSELCRRIFVGSNKSFGFGTPTSLLYRADLVRNSDAFYPNASPHADTSACFQVLRDSDFGFVHQVLSYERTHADTQSSASARLNRYSSACLSDLLEYGPHYLTPDELTRGVRKALRDYHRFLAVNWLIGFRDKAFWDYHKGRLKELGHPLRRRQLLRAAFVHGFHQMLNPEQAARKLWNRVFPQALRRETQSPRTAPADNRAASATGEEPTVSPYEVMPKSRRLGSIHAK